MRLVSTSVLSDMPPPGALLGTTGSASLVEAINSKYAPNYFGTDADPFRQLHQAFMTMVVIPAQEATYKIDQINASVASAPGMDALMSGRYTRLSSVADVINASGVMQQALLFDPEVRKYHESARIGGWGIDTNKWVDSDPYHNALVSGYIPDMAEAFRGTNKDVVFTDHYWYSDADPVYDLDVDDAACVRDSRSFVRFVLQTTDTDPTTGLMQG